VRPTGRVTLVTDELLLEHDTGGGYHPETAARLEALWQRLERNLPAGGLRRLSPPPAEWAWLLEVHEEAYLFRFEEAALSGRSFIDHPDNRLSFDSYRASLIAAGSGPAAIDVIEQDGPGGVTFCAVRPPGHHAEAGRAMGFCFLNNTAVAARYWQKAHGRRRIFILDWDAHHGNGIQRAFEEDPDVFYASIHEHPTFSFPGTGHAEERGRGRGIGATLNVPLAPGAGDAEVLAALRERIEPAMERFGPEAIVVAAGFDGHVEDDMSGLAFSTELYGELGRQTARWGRAFCGERVISLLEGGYHLESLAASAEIYLAGLTAPE